MYYAHFGLKEPPFKITPNTEVFFTGANRGAVLDALIYAITNGEGIVKVVGEVGSGKTMLCRMLQTMLPESVESIFLANPSVAPEHVLHAIAFELQLKLPKNADRLKVMQMLQSYLVASHSAGKQVVVFVEEAQSMPLATLEEIRLLSNLETKHHKLLQIVLFGQPELDVNLNQTNIRQLRERITHGFNLSPLNATEIGEYLIFRLRAAGYFGPPIFTKAAVKKISASAQGLVRRVNILADKALLATFADNEYLVTPKHVNAAINDSEFGSIISTASKKYHLFTSACILLAGLSLGYLISQFKQYPRLNLAYLTAHSQAKPIKKVTTQHLPVIKATVMKNAPTINSSDNKIKATASMAATGKQTTTTVLPLASPAPLLASVNYAQLDGLSNHLHATSTWLSAQAPATVTIQIMGVDNEALLETALIMLAQKIEQENIHVYRTKMIDSALVERPYFTVLYGSFANRQEAIQEMQKLPASIQRNKPQLRTVAGLLQESK